jgi:hypothetical protein
VQSGLANLANQRLIAHAHQMFPLAKVALNAFTTGEMRTVSLIGEMDVSERICAISGSGKRWVRAFGTDPPGETTLDPWLDDPLPRLRHRTGRGVPGLSLSI